MKVLTAYHCGVAGGAAVVERACGPAVRVGESGRGRKEYVLPVLGVEPGGRIEWAELGQNPFGAPVLVACDPVDGVGPAILLAKPSYGHRGGGDVCGHATEARCSCGWRRELASWRDEMVARVELRDGGLYRCPACRKSGLKWSYQPLESVAGVQIIGRGYIAQGDAGYMANANQYVLVVEPGSVVRLRRWGKSKCDPSHYIVHWDGRVAVGYTVDDALTVAPEWLVQPSDSP